MKIIHLIMANENSETGYFYNKSTFNFIKKIIETNLNFVKFPIREFLFEQSKDFFNYPLENIDDLKIIDENDKKLIKYTGKAYELKECYIDELENTKLIQSNYKPNYRVYKAKYKGNQTIKLIIDIEINGKVKEININKFSKNKHNIINVHGKRILKKKKMKIHINLYHITNLVILIMMSQFLI